MEKKKSYDSLCQKLCFKITLNGRHMAWLDIGTQSMPTGAGVSLPLISTLFLVDFDFQEDSPLMFSSSC